MSLLSLQEVPLHLSLFPAACAPGLRKPPKGRCESAAPDCRVPRGRRSRYSPKRQSVIRFRDRRRPFAFRKANSGLPGRRLCRNTARQTSGIRAWIKRRGLSPYRTQGRPVLLSREAPVIHHSRVSVQDRPLGRHFLRGYGSPPECRARRGVRPHGHAGPWERSSESLSGRGLFSGRRRPGRCCPPVRGDGSCGRSLTPGRRLSA